MPDYTLNNLWEFDHPDYSSFVIHFTGRTGARSPGAVGDIARLSPFDRLHQVLVDQQLLAFEMFQTPDPVVCFTECTVETVRYLVRTSRYAPPYGIAFRKNTIFKRGGGPALYVRGDAFHHVSALPREIRSLCTRYWPGVRREGGWNTEDSFIDRVSEWTHEREWRILGAGDPSAFTFGWDEVAFVMLPDSEEEAGEFFAALEHYAPEVAAEVESHVRFVFISEAGDVDDPTGAWLIP